MTLSPEELKAIEDRANAATQGPWELAIFDETKDPLEWIRECLSHGSGPVHLTWCPGHPLTKGQYPRPEHAVVPAITGNGPTSEANAKFLAHAREDIPKLLAELRRVTEERDGLREAAEMVLLYHSGSPWDAAKAKRWERWTGSDDATTRNMCDQIRAILSRARDGAG